MRMTSVRLFFALALCGLAPFYSLAASQFGDVTVNAEPSSAEKSHGYAEYRVVITNSSLSARHDVTVTAPHPAGSSSLIEVTRSITVEPRSTVTVSMFAPAGIYGAGLEVSVDGRVQREVVPASLSQHRYSGEPSVLLSKGASSKGFDALSEAAFRDPSRGSGSSGPTYAKASSELQVSVWSDNWLSYSGYDGVVVTADELAQAPAAVSSALWRWVECGGSLFIIGAFDLPQPWRGRKLDSAPLPTCYAGFGQCIVSGADSLKTLTKPQWEHAKKSWLNTSMPFQTVRTGGPAGTNALLTPEGYPVPVRGMFLVMLLFVAVIGPINLLILSRKKKKMWLLWTVPAISLLTCLAVSAYSILSEGLKGHSRAVSLTILDETSHRAATIGLVGYYTPLTPGDGLHFSYETEVTLPGRAYNYGYSQDAGYRTIDWTQDQHLESGWINARTPANLQIRRSESRRERIVIRQEPDGSLTAVNGLGAAVRELWVADVKGRIYVARDVAAGAAALLTAAPTSNAAARVDFLRSLYDNDWTQLASGAADPVKWLRPGCYVAALDSCPFVEEGLRGVESRRCEALVYGIMKESPDEN